MLNIFPNLNLYILVNSMIIKNYVKLLSVKLKLLKAYYQQKRKISYYSNTSDAASDT